MKRLLIALVALALLTVPVESGFAQRNTRGTAMLQLAGKSISVEYGRPSLKGRAVTDLLGQLKQGGFWRLGADQSTTFKTSADLQFGDVTVPSGEYSLWAEREGDNSWKLVFNKQHGQWGTQHDAAQDLVSAPLKESEASDSAETVTILLSKAGSKGGAITIQWGTMKLSADFKLK
jgi:hypothetical protein